MKKLMAGAALAATMISASMAHADTETPDGVIHAVFDAMRAGNGEAIKKLATPHTRLDRLHSDGRLEQGVLSDWADWVDKQSAGDADERVFGVQTLSRSPELATVWAPFTIRYKGELVGCGVNQFTLAKTSEGWRIVYGVDMPSQDDCNTFPDQFMK